MDLQKLIDGLKAHKYGAAAYESVDEAIRVFEAMRDVDGERACQGLQTAVDSDWLWQRADFIAMCCKEALALIRQQRERIAVLEAAQTAKWEEPVAEGVWSWAKPAYAQCSSCKKKSYLGWKDPYCRYCGAKMMFDPPKEEEHESLERNRP